MTGTCKIIIIVCLAGLISITPAISSEKKNGAKAGEMINKSMSSKSATERYFDNCREKFKKLDKNSDGCLTSADYELSKFKIALLMSTPSCQKIIEALIVENRKKTLKYALLDINKDGQVSFEEFIPRQFAFREHSRK